MHHHKSSHDEQVHSTYTYAISIIFYIHLIPYSHIISFSYSSQLQVSPFIPLEYGFFENSAIYNNQLLKIFNNLLNLYYSTLSTSLLSTKDSSFTHSLKMLQTLSNFVHQGWQTATSTFGNENKPKIDIDDLPEFTLSEVSEHWQSDDCWIVVFDRVYDVTDFVDEHPGGAFIMQEHFGRDATLVFRGSRHGPDAYDMLDKFLIGVLVESERMYLGPDMWLER